MNNRPSNVPSQAQWSEAQKAWIVGDPKAGGRVDYFRADGTPWCEYTYAEGVLHGAFRRFHDNGEVASQGEMARGRFIGKSSTFRSRAASSEAFPDQFGPAVWRIEVDYDDSGTPTAQRMYGQDGREMSAEELMRALMGANPHVAEALKNHVG